MAALPGAADNKQQFTIRAYVDTHVRFLNNIDYIFSMMDTTNNEKVLKTMGLAYWIVVDIQCQYEILGDEENHKDSLVDLAMAIINLYYRGIKDIYKKKEVACHRAWVRRLDDVNIKYAAKYVHVMQSR
ncbi:hypothetical protein D1007_37202 [Hordeum vulgare]|nr:hypothetical protein D1007_37202 [Hordeum vulgare]